MFQQLFQNDPRWQNEILGFGSTQTIGQFGCLVTCMAMVGNHFGGSETPASLNNKLKQADGFSQALVKTYRISAVYPNVRYQKYYARQGQPLPLNEIDGALAAGSLAVVHVDRSPLPGIQDHWVVVHQKQGNDYLIWDPYNVPNAANTLIGRYGTVGAPADIIQEVILFGQGNLPQPTSPSTPLASTDKPGTSEKLVLRPAVTGLALRKEPYKLIPENEIGRLNPTDSLQALEANQAALAKIGQQNQWLRVRHLESGREGYVAAWLVRPTGEPAPTAPATGQSQPAAAPAKLFVATTAAGLTLRSAARVAPETVIDYLEDLGTELLVLEGTGAAAKIGQNGQWLNAQVLTGRLAGRTGYVAAWFVQRK